MIDLDRTLVLGGSGMVGSQVSFGIKPTHYELDITDPDSLARAMESHQPTAILLLAGVIDVKKAEADPAEAERVNVGGSAAVAECAAKANIPLVYFSSCMVFDGEKREPYSEDDVPNPLTVYGKTKLKGEEVVLEIAPRALVVRTGWLFGGFEKDIKFIHRFYDMLCAGQSIRATNDRYGSPTYVPDLVSEVARLIQSESTGIAHVVNARVASYYEVALTLKELTKSPAEIIGLTQRELDPSSEPRGSMEALVSNRGVTLRPYEEALAEYVASLSTRPSL